MSYDLGLTDPDDDLPSVAPDTLPASPPAPDMPGHIASISDNSYRGYDGPLKNRAVRWWIVAVATIRANVNKSRFGFWIPAGIILITYLISGVIFYFSQNIKTQMAAMQGLDPSASTANPYATELYTTMSWGFVNLCVFIAALVVGSSSIAADNRANALLVYLSKPLTRFDYLFGKWMGIFILLASIILVPSIFTYLFFVGVYYSDGFLKDNPTLIFKVILAGLLPALLHSSLIIGFSAWSKSSRIAGSVYAAFYLVLGILTTIIGTVMWFGDKSGAHLARTAIVFNSSVDGVRNGLAQHIYDIDPPTFNGLNASGRRRHRKHQDDQPEPELPDKTPERAPLYAMLLIGGAYIILPLAAAQMKVRAVEVIRG